MRITLGLLLFTGAMIAVTTNAPAPMAAEDTKSVTYAKDVEPILSSSWMNVCVMLPG